MKKSYVIYNIIIIVLIIALGVMTFCFFKMRNVAKDNLEGMLKAANEVYESNIKINNLEDKLNRYESNDIGYSVVHNTVNTVNSNTTNNNHISNSTEPYIPDGMPVADPNDNSGVKASDIKFNRNPEKVEIKVLKDTITNTSVEILITDNNEEKYSWGVEFKVQKKVNGNWTNLEYAKENVAWIAIAYNLDENNELKQKLDIKEYYGVLEKGIYRISKQVYNDGYIDIYSDEFEIK